MPSATSSQKSIPWIKNLGFNLAVTAIATIGLVSCQASEINIQDVAKRKSGKTIYLTGKVTHQAPLLDRAAYQLQDETGSIWVVTSQTLPKPEAIISIKGKVQYQSLPVDGTELGEFYVIELQQLEAPLKQ